MLELNGLGKRILVIPDTHHPYQHQDIYHFLGEIKRQFRPDIVIHLGDEVDHAAISFHDKPGEMMGAADELDKAIEYLHQDIAKLFPKLFLLESNHGSLLLRRLRHAGIPVRTLMPLEQLYRVPKWSWHDDIILNTKLGPVYLCHGKASPPGKLALTEGMSAIQGHFHNQFYVQWLKFANRRVFDIKSGCLVDIDHMAFAYGKNHIPKPNLGATIIHANGVPELVPLL